MQAMCQGELTGKHFHELVGVIKTAYLLQLRDHATLGIIRCGSGLYQSLGKLLLVELLEDILIVDEFEDDHLTLSNWRWPNDGHKGKLEKRQSGKGYET